MTADDKRGMKAQPEDGHTVADRLEHLFATVHPANRGPYLLKEVVAEINERAGREVVSVSYLSRVRRGERPNPSHAVIAGLADFFGVPVDYFTRSSVAERVDSQLELAKTLQDQGVAKIAMRSAGLSEQSLRTILAVIENARSLENLPDDESLASPISPGQRTGQVRSHRHHMPHCDIFVTLRVE